MLVNLGRLQSPTLGVLPPVRPVLPDRGSSVLYSAIIIRAPPPERKPNSHSKQHSDPLLCQRAHSKYPLKTFYLNLLEVPFEFPYTDRMQNKEHRISGSINTGVSVCIGEHEYEEGHPKVVEIAFEGYNCTYIQVIDLKTAGELIKQLKALHIPEAE
jgi:hypothetical protein